MEKKGNRLVQPASKGLPSDSKKSQDGAGGGKPWPRGGRRREPASGSLAAKSEACRIKSNSQRNTNKSFDKRPRPRGAYDAAAAAGRAEAAGIVYEEKAEVGSIFSPGSKKQSLNHLLNFQYASHTPDERRHFHSGRFNNHNMHASLGKHKFTKEHFLNNNCQFVVNSSGDYTKYRDDPDALVDWNLIEQVNLQVSEYPSCPICLYPPVAAKMTRCGHIYCWSCMLHYLALSDKSSRKCPICEDHVIKKDLKSVVAIPHNSFNLRDIITFKLMKRLKGSLIAYPASATVREDDSFFSLSEKEAGDCYSKLLLANQAEIMSIIERESEELQLQLHENKDCPESCFIDEALTLLDERKTSVLAFEGRQAEGQSYRKLALEDLEINDNNSSSNNEKDSDDSIASTNLEHLDCEYNILSSNTIGQHSSKFHYFYQAADGQHIYLHGVNARMLEHTYGSLEFGPQQLTGKILEKEEGLMTEQLRKKLRYLQHLPVTCPFELAEIELKDPIINFETVQLFNEQIDGRRRKRQKRAQEEKRREKRITQEQNRQLGKYPVPDLHLESQFQFPSFEPSLTRAESEGTQSSEGGSADDITPSSSLGLENESSAPSFAKMLASKRETPKWPILKPSGADPAPVKLITVTGSNMRPGIASVRRHEDSEPETEERISLPPCSVLSDVFGEALQRYERQDHPSSQMQLTKKNKKKNKHKFVPLTNL